MALGNPKHQHKAQQSGDRQRDDVRCGSDSEDHGEEENARTPLYTAATETCGSTPRSKGPHFGDPGGWGPGPGARFLHGVSDTDAGVDAAEDSERREDFRVGRHAYFENGRGKAIEGECGVAAEVAIETPRDPPDATAEDEASEE